MGNTTPKDFVVLNTSIPYETDQWLRVTAKKVGISKAMLLRAILHQARIEERPIQLTTGGGS